MIVKNANHYFLQGGGEMGELIRAKDWSKTSLGDPADWPQSLCTMISVMLNNPFGMYIAWGNDYIQLYNDGYRPILGATKHPMALGISTRETFSEIWHIIESMFNGVMKGTAVGFPDFMLPLNRHGYKEECYFDFSYSPIRKDNGEVGGVLVTVIETTSQKKIEKALKESQQRFRDTVQQAPVGITILRGKDYIVEMANDAYLQLIDRKVTEFVGRPLFDSLPEVRESVQGLLDGVLSTGLPFHGNEIPIPVNRYGKQEVFYFDFLYHALKEDDGEISGIIVTVTEVSEKVATRKKIEQSEKKFQAAIAAVEGIMWTNNENGEMIGVQPGWAKLTGQRFDEYQGYGWAKAVHPEDAQPTIDAWNIAVANQSTFVFEHRVKTKHNSWRLFSIKAVPSFDEKGIIQQWVGVHTDITEKKEAEQKLAYRTALLEAHNEASVEGIILVDAKGKILSFNQRFLELWNMPQHIVDANDDEAALTFAMTQLVNPQQFIDKVKYLYEHPTETSVDELEFKDGRIVERNGYPVIGEDSIYYAWSWSFKDITSKKNYEKKLQESEERFRSLAQTLPQLIWTTDAQGKLEFTSLRWKEYTGIEPGGEKEWKAIVHSDDYDKINTAWMHSLTTGDIYTYDVRLRNKNGEYRWHSVIAEPVLDKENKIVKWVGAFTDTHSEKLFTQELELKVRQRTNELQQFNIELERKNNDLESFAYISSHDLQEPLRKIQTFATRIIENEYETLSENGKHYIKRMQDSANRMQTLIKDLLVYSKTNTIERNLENADLNKIIDEVKGDLSEELKDKQATIEATNMCEIKIIPFQFRQLMHNLIGNALKFSRPHTAPHIKIKSEIAKGINFNNEKLHPQIEYCHISISDNGIGFEQQYSEKIFEVFQRLHGKTQYNGTGIGLSIVKKIVENHEGIITANSELNKGATFDIYIPVT